MSSKNTFFLLLSCVCLIFQLKIAKGQTSQFNLTTNADGTLTISQYIGTNQIVSVPSSIGGLTVTAIGFGAFQGTPVASVALPSTIQSVGINAFGGSGLEYFEIPNDVRSIPPACFMGCSALTNVTIPNGVTNVGDSAFQGCNFQCLNLPDTVTSIGDHSFAGSGLTSINIPGTVTSIGDYAFAESELASITFGGSTALSEYCFEGCANLTSLNISSNLASFGDYAFESSGLTSVVIPSTFSGSLGAYTFADCGALTNVVIGSGVTDVGYATFAGSTSLENIYFEGNAVTYGPCDNEIGGGPNLVAYINAGTTGWGSTFASPCSRQIPIIVIGLTNAAPTIQSQPQDVVANANESSGFSVTVSGVPPFNYEWLFNQSNLLTANPGGLTAKTSSTVIIPQAAPDNIGEYSVIISNYYGSVTSSVAQLYLAPYIASPFSGAICIWGQTNMLGLKAWGSSDLSYQWYFNGVAMAGATGSNYLLSGIQFTNAGLYSVVVSSKYGSITNTPEQVVVNPANVSLGLFAGIIVQGTVGYNYNIQASTDLGDTNSWNTLTNLTLASPVEIWSDYSVDVHTGPQKFYRVLPGQ